MFSQAFVCPQGWVISQHVLQVTCPGGSASRGLHRGGVCIKGRGWAETPPHADPPQIHGIKRDTVNKWAVRILLECILVKQGFCSKLHENETNGTKRGAHFSITSWIRQWQHFGLQSGVLHLPLFLAPDIYLLPNWKQWTKFSLNHNQYTDSFIAWVDLQPIDLQPGFIPQSVTAEYLLCNLRRCDSFMANKKPALRFL